MRTLRRLSASAGFAVLAGELSVGLPGATLVNEARTKFSAFLATGEPEPHRTDGKHVREPDAAGQQHRGSAFECSAASGTRTDAFLRPMRAAVRPETQ